ncbi:MAG: HAMP domain-containing protein [Rubrivivax sp.]|nr:HAMP domain-containing protein [Rubrivivax sp.]
MRRSRWRHSIRARLVLLFLLFALALTGVFLFGTSRMLKGGWQTWAQPLVRDYVDRVAAEIGSPPSAERARALEQRLPVVIRIEGPQVQHDAHPERWRSADEHGPPEGFGLTRTTADGHRLSFALASRPDVGRPRLLGWATLAALLVLTLAAWGVVQHLLRPLRAIGAGAERYGRGDFSQPIAVRHRDELADLAERVNAMARGLQGMLEDKRALLLAISHELRSPLTRARLNAELVAEGPSRDALLRDLAEMRDLIGSLLESERIAAGAPALQLSEVDLGALARRAAEGRGVALELPDPAPVLQADATRLELLLRNLLDNAQRHGADAAEPPCLFLRPQGEGGWALGVRDHGPGVPPDQVERLAQAFHRPDSARTRAAGGVGLGLYLCRLVAQAHGGRLSIRNAEPGLEVAMVWRPSDTLRG